MESTSSSEKNLDSLTRSDGISPRNVSQTSMMQVVPVEIARSFQRDEPRRDGADWRGPLESSAGVPRRKDGQPARREALSTSSGERGGHASSRGVDCATRTSKPGRGGNSSRGARTLTKKKASAVCVKGMNTFTRRDLPSPTTPSSEGSSRDDQHIEEVVMESGRGKEPGKEPEATGCPSDVRLGGPVEPRSHRGTKQADTTSRPDKPAAPSAGSTSPASKDSRPPAATARGTAKRKSRSLSARARASATEAAGGRPSTGPSGGTAVDETPSGAGPLKWSGARLEPSPPGRLPARPPCQSESRGMEEDRGVRASQSTGRRSGTGNTRRSSRASAGGRTETSKKPAATTLPGTLDQGGGLEGEPETSGGLSAPHAKRNDDSEEPSSSCDTAASCANGTTAPATRRPQRAGARGRRGSTGKTPGRSQKETTVKKEIAAGRRDSGGSGSTREVGESTCESPSEEPEPEASTVALPSGSGIGQSEAGDNESRDQGTGVRDRCGSEPASAGEDQSSVAASLKKSKRVAAMASGLTSGASTSKETASKRKARSPDQEGKADQPTTDADRSKKRKLGKADAGGGGSKSAGRRHRLPPPPPTPVLNDRILSRIKLITAAGGHGWGPPPSPPPSPPPPISPSPPTDPVDAPGINKEQDVVESTTRTETPESKPAPESCQQATGATDRAATTDGKDTVDDGTEGRDTPNGERGGAIESSKNASSVTAEAPERADVAVEPQSSAPEPVAEPESLPSGSEPESSAESAEEIAGMREGCDQAASQPEAEPSTEAAYSEEPVVFGDGKVLIERRSGLETAGSS